MMYLLKFCLEEFPLSRGTKAGSFDCGTSCTFYWMFDWSSGI